MSKAPTGAFVAAVVALVSSGCYLDLRDGIKCRSDSDCHGLSCANGTCKADGATGTACVPVCAGRQCGPDGCGGSCGTCAGTTRCNSQMRQCQAVCTTACSGRACGDDGCGGSCGTCAGIGQCNLQSGQCQAVCIPNCSGRNCGDNGCGKSCGTCAGGNWCDVQRGHCRTLVCVSFPSSTPRKVCTKTCTAATVCTTSGATCIIDDGTQVCGFPATAGTPAYPDGTASCQTTDDCCAYDPC